MGHASPSMVQRSVPGRVVRPSHCPAASGRPRSGAKPAGSLATTFARTVHSRGSWAVGGPAAGAALGTSGATAGGVASAPGAAGSP